jgi:hypothetical protein
MTNSGCYAVVMMGTHCVLYLVVLCDMINWHYLGRVTRTYVSIMMGP